MHLEKEKNMFYDDRVKSFVNLGHVGEVVVEAVGDEGKVAALRDNRYLFPPHRQHHPPRTRQSFAI